ncbi:hypothetical protein ACFWNK_34320 [Streptomyces sp. NPDC058417]
MTTPVGELAESARQKIVEHHGGTIRLDPTTCITFALADTTPDD